MAVLKTPNGYDSQNWFFDWKTRTIKSQKTKTSSLDARTTWMYVYGSTSAKYQIFKYEKEGSFLRNHFDKRVLTVRDDKDVEGQYTQPLAQSGNKQGQRWKIVYLDKKGP